MTELKPQLDTAKALFSSLSQMYSTLLQCHGHDPPNESLLTALTEHRDVAHAATLLEKLDSEIGAYKQFWNLNGRKNI